MFSSSSLFLFWLLAAAAQSKDGDVPERNSSREGHEIGRLLLLERLIERVSICVCVCLGFFLYILKLYLDNFETTPASRL